MSQARFELFTIENTYLHYLEYIIVIFFLIFVTSILNLLICILSKLFKLIFIFFYSSLIFVCWHRPLVLLFDSSVFFWLLTYYRIKYTNKITRFFLLSTTNFILFFLCLSESFTFNQLSNIDDFFQTW